MTPQPTARRCNSHQRSAPTWMAVEVLVVLLLVQLQSGSALLRENDRCELNGSPGVCRQFAACRDELENKPIKVCTHSPGGTIVCCPENRPVRTAVRKCNEYRKLSYDEVTAIGLSLVPFVARNKVPTCDSITRLIVGGTVTKPGEFPHMAAIGWRQTDQTMSFNCGGSLISERFVLTAAHCNTAIDGVRPSFVRLGDQHLFRQNDGAEPKDYNIAEFIKHPDFAHPSRYNDIALVKLDRTVAFSRFIRPACLYDREATPTKQAIATGFGNLEAHGEPSNELMKVSLNIYGNERCTKAFADQRSVPSGVQANQLCAGNMEEGDKDTCQGDSGGPLQITDQGNVCNFYVVGITSIGIFCGSQQPAIYTRVASFLSWIETTVWN